MNGTNDDRLVPAVQRLQALVPRAGALPPALLENLELVASIDLRIVGVPVLGEVEILNDKDLRLKIGALLTYKEPVHRVRLGPFDYTFDSTQSPAMKLNVAGASGLLGLIEQLLALLAALRGAGADKPTGDAPGKGGTVEPPTDRKLYPSGVRILVKRVFRGPGDTGEDFPAHLEGRRLVLDVPSGKGDHLEQLPAQSGVEFQAEYLDKDGNPFRFEDQTPPALHLYNTARWEVDAGDSRVTLAAPGYSTQQTGSKRAANFREDLLRRYNGMEGVLHFPREIDGLKPTLRLIVDTPGGRLHDEIEFPRIS